MQFTLPVCLFSHKIPHKASSLPTYLSDRSRYSHVLLAWGCPRADVPLLQGMQQHLPGTHGQESIAWNTSCNSKDRMWLRVTPRQGGRAAAVQHWGLVVSSWFVVELWFRCLQPSSSSLVMWCMEIKYESCQNHLAVGEISLLTLPFLWQQLCHRTHFWTAAVTLRTTFRRAATEVTASAGILHSPALPWVLPFVVEVLRVTTSLELCEVIVSISNCLFSTHSFFYCPNQNSGSYFLSPVKRKCRNSSCNSTDSNIEVTLGSNKRFCSLCLQTFTIQATEQHFSSQLLVSVFRKRSQKKTVWGW